MKLVYLSDCRGVTEAAGACQLIYSDSGQVPLHGEGVCLHSKDKSLNDSLGCKRVDRQDKQKQMQTTGNK